MGVARNRLCSRTSHEDNASDEGRGSAHGPCPQQSRHAPDAEQHRARSEEVRGEVRAVERHDAGDGRDGEERAKCEFRAQACRVPPTRIGVEHVPTVRREGCRVANGRKTVCPDVARRQHHEDHRKHADDERGLSYVPSDRFHREALVAGKSTTQRRERCSPHPTDLDAPAPLEPEQFRVAHRALCPSMSALRQRGRGVADVPHPRSHPVESVPPPEEQRHDPLDDADEEVERYDPCKRQPPVDLEVSPDPACFLQPTVVPLVGTNVRDLGCRADDGPSPLEASTLGEIDRSRDRSHSRVDAPDACQEVSPDEHRDAGDGGDVTDDVVLTLVPFGPVEARIGNAEGIGHETHGHEPPILSEDLRADDARIGANRIIDEGRERVGCRFRAFPDEPHELGRRPDGRERSVGRFEPRKLGGEFAGRLPADEHRTCRLVHLSTDSRKGVAQAACSVRDHDRRDGGMSCWGERHVGCILESIRRYSNHRVVLLAGGVGGARMARALRGVVDPGHLTVVVNVGDDDERYGVHVSADPDTVLYTLAGIVGQHGWGRDGDTTTIMDALTKAGIDTTFMLGDRDYALCLARTLMMQGGERLSGTIRHFSEQFGVGDVTLLPATDDPLRTFVRTGGEWLPFQEYFVDRGHTDPVDDIEFRGAATAEPAPGVVDAIEKADTVVIAPSNPPLSIWPILAVADIDRAVRTHQQRIAVSPLFGGKPLKGPADAVMSGLGLPNGTRGVIEAYRGVIDVLYIDESDASDRAVGTEYGVTVVPADTRLGGTDLGASLAARIVGGEE